MFIDFTALFSSKSVKTVSVPEDQLIFSMTGPKVCGYCKEYSKSGIYGKYPNNANYFF